MVIIIVWPKPIKYLGPAKLIAGQPNQILAGPIGQPRKKLSLTPDVGISVMNEIIDHCFWFINQQKSVMNINYWSINIYLVIINVQV